jgi:hypothetical protein
VADASFQKCSNRGMASAVWLVMLEMALSAARFMVQSEFPSQVLRNLILDQAIAAIRYSATERQQFLQQFQIRSDLNTANNLARLQQEGVTDAQIDEWIDREIRIRKFQRQQWGKQLNSYFFQRKYQLDQVVCSLIYLQELDLAQELYFRILEGEQSFTELARRYSLTSQKVSPEPKVSLEIDPEGRVGPIALGALPPKLARMFYGARVGQLWPPVELGAWVVIARLDASMPVQLDESLHQMLLNELLEQWLKTQLKQRFS